ncbi:MAG: hypothetical protein RBR14_06505 [Candidatus Cloacimonas acidaminovorans]|nr:hypothetical protein [Candidatus Cloacimonas acidaminovorans]
MEDICNKKGLPKILPSVYKAIKYAYLAVNGKIEYPFPGSWEHQPIWLIELIEVAQAEIYKLRKKDNADQ